MERRPPPRPVGAAPCLALALTAPPAAAAGEWVAEEANTAHDGLVDASTLTPPLRERWAVDLGYVSSPALVAAGKVFAIAAGSPFATVNAVDATNGVTLWSRPLDGATSAAYDDGRVFVVTAAGDVVAFQADTGVPLWRRATGGGWEGAPTARGGAVYVAT